MNPAIFSGISSPSYNVPMNKAWCLPFPIIKTKKKRFFFEKSVYVDTKPSNQMQCLSESCGGSHLFLESVRIAIHLHLVSPSPLQCWFVHTLFLQRFIIVWGGGGEGKVMQFRTDNSAFLKLPFENTQN